MYFFKKLKNKTRGFIQYDNFDSPSAKLSRLCRDNRSCSTGFTLIELTAAIFIITVALVSVLVAVQQINVLADAGMDKINAIYLAQEGLELVRNVRDGNWLEKRTNSAIDMCDQLAGAEDYEADYTMSQSFPVCVAPCPYSSLRYLGADVNGFYGYNYPPGNETKFKRKIHIECRPIMAPDGLFATVEVFWEYKGNTKSVLAKDYLYDWKIGEF